MEEKKIKAVIFDMDGVLINTEKFLVKYWCQAAAEYGFEMKPEHGQMLRSLSGKFAAPKMESIFGKEFNYEAIRARRKELMEQHIKNYGIEKKSGADEALNYLRANGFKTAVATATDPVRTEAYLKNIGIYHLFDKIICASMVQNGKPMPDIYLYACEQIGESPKSCIAVEDSPNGILSAYRAGLRTIMIPDLTKPDTELEPYIYAVAESLFELTLESRSKEFYG